MVNLKKWGRHVCNSTKTRAIVLAISNQQKHIFKRQRIGIQQRKQWDLYCNTYIAIPSHDTDFFDGLYHPLMAKLGMVSRGNHAQITLLQVSELIYQCI